MVFGYQPIHDHDERHTHHRILRKSIPIAIILICICILLVVTFWTKPDNLPPSPFLIISKNGAVATEVDKCSNIGVDILKDGGSAVDAAIAAELCVGTINAFSAGIGGGGLMLIRSPNGTAEIIDFRETAPLKATKNMFVGTPKDASIGVRSVAVP
ncbi:putative Gamma-glutamyltransferase [Gigaspora margarita]|uniref:Putative Gamma-glutamyltransferase n=1 Tax=Gigaspora margarita TaxID=4874 RepID=A0A8H3WVS2_GIGMA|nr:putative Gamma-glutamyltransferase [Gigaspora margarita]